MAANSHTVATGGRAGRGARSRARPESVVVPFPRPAVSGRLALGRFVPSGRTFLRLVLVLAAAAGCWWVARETSLFATRAIDVEGAPPPLARAVEQALVSALGESLVALDFSALERTVEALPAVAAVRFDRAYPGTLRALITPERPVAVVRQGQASLLVSERGRVIASLVRGARRDLPRVWFAAEEPFAVGGFVSETIKPAIGAVSPHAGVAFKAWVMSVRFSEDELTLRLRRGLEVRLGNAEDLALKLAVAARILPLVEPGSAYLDVSVVERPVAGAGFVSSLGAILSNPQR